MHTGVPSLWGTVISHFNTGIPTPCSQFHRGRDGRFHQEPTGEAKAKRSPAPSLVQLKAPNREGLSGSHLAHTKPSCESESDTSCGWRHCMSAPLWEPPSPCEGDICRGAPCWASGVPLQPCTPPQGSRAGAPPVGPQGLNALARPARFTLVKPKSHLLSC